MHLSIVSLSLLPAVLAQYGGSAPETTASAAVEGVHVVKVGEGGLTFDPAELQASVGDVIEFHFYPQTHSVARSSFDAPCRASNSSGFFSGNIAVQSGVGSEVFSITVENEDPIWYYCATGQHCQGGMVGVVNAPSGSTLEQFSQAAGSAEEVTVPSQTGGGTLGAPATATPTPTPAGNAGVRMRGDVALAGLGALFGFLV